MDYGGYSITGCTRFPRSLRKLQQVARSEGRVLFTATLAFAATFGTSALHSSSPFNILRRTHMQQRDPDRVTRTGVRDSTTGSGAIIAGLFVVGLLIFGYMMFWPTADRTTNLTDSTRMDRTAPTTTTMPPTNKPLTDVKPITPPPAKTPAQ
jgi:hypothetical protein